MNILSIESSCDETAVAIIKDGREILENLVYSQIDIHKEWGGVVPEIASRKHVEIIDKLAQEVLEKGHKIDAVACTVAPGLIGALLVGANFAKSYAYAKNLPFIPVHHIRGHIAANYLAFSQLKPPFMCLVASGGHSLIVKVSDYTEMEILGTTKDDAAGEAFDKVARVLGFSYPGGKVIDEKAQIGDVTKYDMPRAKIKDRPYDFSFSGLKTSVINKVHNAKQKGEELDINSLCASFNKAVSDTFVSRLIPLLKRENLDTLVCAGGVVANSMIRKDLQNACLEQNIKLFLPPLDLCSDNAAMIGAQAYYEYEQGHLGKVSQNCYGSLPITRDVYNID